MKSSRPTWPEFHIEQLAELNTQGYSARAIFNMNVFSYSEKEIEKMLSILILKKAKKISFPMEVAERFKSFIRQNWIGKTPEELLEVWNKSNAKFPATKKKITQCLNDMGFKISKEEVNNIKKLRVKEKKIMNNSAPTSNVMLEKLRMERVKLMRSRVENERDIWSGLDCKKKEVAG